MIVVDVEQRSSEWFSARCGSVTSSRVAQVIAKRKDGKESAERRNLRYEIVCERLTGNISDNYVSRYMKDGIEREPAAADEYQLRTGVFVEPVGYVQHPRIKWAGWSPDGIIGKTGAIEAKCPKPETHIAYLLGGEIPEDYLPQCRWGLSCGELDWIDFVSHHPAFPHDSEIFIKRLYRDKENEAIIRGMEAEVEQFLSEVEAMVEKLGGMPDRKRKAEALAGAELITEEDYREFLQ